MANSTANKKRAAKQKKNAGGDARSECSGGQTSEEKYDQHDEPRLPPRPSFVNVGILVYSFAVDTWNGLSRRTLVLIGYAFLATVTLVSFN